MLARIRKIFGRANATALPSSNLPTYLDDRNQLYNPQTTGQVDVAVMGAENHGERAGNTQLTHPETEALGPNEKFLCDDGSVFSYLDVYDVRGGMTPLDRKYQKFCLFFLILGAAVGLSVAIGVSVRRRMRYARYASPGSMSSLGWGGGGSIHIAPPPPDLPQTCSPLAVSTDGGWEECERLCAEAECCLVPEGHWFSCDMGNEVDCKAYESACATLEHVENLKKDLGGGSERNPLPASVPAVKVFPAPLDLNVICDPESLSTIDGFAACSDACLPASCCFDPSNTSLCVVSNPDACDRYGACSILDGSPSHPSSLPSQSKAKCNTQALKSADSVRNCRQFCAPAMCCFTSLGMGETEEEDCLTETSEAWCGQYATCQGLFHIGDGDEDFFGDDSEAKDAVDDACGMGYRPCVNICDPAECCFRSALLHHTCEDGLFDLNCDHYQACETLYSTIIINDIKGEAKKIQLEEPPSRFDHICSSPLSNDISICEHLCHNAHCCSESDEACIVENSEACMGYTPYCQDVWSSMTEDVVVPEPPPDLEKQCEADLDFPQGSETCKQACDAAACCDDPISTCKVR